MNIREALVVATTVFGSAGGFAAAQAEASETIAPPGGTLKSPAAAALLICEWLVVILRTNLDSSPDL